VAQADCRRALTVFKQHSDGDRLPMVVVPVAQRDPLFAPVSWTLGYVLPNMPMKRTVASGARRLSAMRSTDVRGL